MKLLQNFHTLIRGKPSALALVAVLSYGTGLTLAVTQAALLTQNATTNIAAIKIHSVHSRSSASSSAPSLHAAAPVAARPDLRVLRKNAASATPIVVPSLSVYQKAGCGDGIVVNEQCDDGNTKNADGCSSTCTIEPGYQCTSSQPSHCWATCGDGAVAASEQCDDGNLNNDDGCSASCKIEMGYKCTGSPSICLIPPVCSNRVLEKGEQCDDGNLNNGDGCDSNCQLEQRAP